MPGIPRLIVHIGAGKTGSSSIQMTLDRNPRVLAAAGVRYLGLMLEHATARPVAARPAWQRQTGSPDFFERTAPDECNAAMHDILSAELDHLAAAGIRTAVWSNEWMYGRHDRVIGAVEKLRDAGVPVTVLCYLRRHDKWAQSAYLQWGVKNKNYAGPIRSFDDWIAGQKVAMHSDVAPWIERFGTDVQLVNFDAAGDTVADFAGRIGVEIGEAGMTPMRENVTPEAELLAAWAVHNNRIQEPVPMGRFQNLTAHLRAVDRTGSELPPLSDLLPTAERLAGVLSDEAEDIAAVNAAFAACGEPPFDLSAPALPIRAPDGWELDRYLLKTVFSLQEQVENLRRRVIELERGGSGP